MVKINCNKEIMDRLYKYQDEEIEHQDPPTPASPAIEAAGDIFRDFTNSLCWIDISYIKSKLRILENYAYESGQDALEHCKWYMKKDKPQIGEWYKKLEEFKDKVEKEDIIDPRREKVLLKIPQLQQDLLRWASYHTGTQYIEKEIKDFIKIVNNIID